MSLSTMTQLSEAAKVAVASAIVAQNSQNDLRLTVTQYFLNSGEGSISVPSYATGVAQKVNEGVDGTTTQIDPAGVVLAPRASALESFLLSDVANVGANQIAALRGQIAARNLQNRYNQDIYGLFPSFTNSVGAANAAVTVETVKAAKKILVKNDEGFGDPFLVLTPIMWDQLSDDLINLGISLSDNQVEQVLSGSGLIPLFGCRPVVVSSKIDEDTTVTGGLYHSTAIGWAEYSDLPLVAKEIEKPTSVQLVMHKPYDVKITAPAHGVKILALGEV